MEDSIIICQLFRQHGGNASLIIEKLHAKHRLTQLRTDLQKHQSKIKDHVKSLLKPSHSIWDESVAIFKPTLKQKAQLDAIKNDENRNLLLSNLEREFSAPLEQDQLNKIQLRKLLEAIKNDEKKICSSTTICAKELNFNLFNKQDERQQVRRTAQIQQQRRVSSEQKINLLGIQMAQSTETHAEYEFHPASISAITCLGKFAEIASNIRKQSSARRSIN